MSPPSTTPKVIERWSTHELTQAEPYYKTTGRHDKFQLVRTVAPSYPCFCNHALAAMPTNSRYSLPTIRPPQGPHPSPGFRTVAGSASGLVRKITLRLKHPLELPKPPRRNRFESRKCPG